MTKHTNLVRPAGTFLNTSVLSLLCAVSDFVREHPEHKGTLGDLIVDYADKMNNGKPVAISLAKPFGMVVEALVENDQLVDGLQADADGADQ